MTDILFLTHNRLEFTKATLTALLAHTDWSKVNKLIWYDDNSTDGTRVFMDELYRLGWNFPGKLVYRTGYYGSPVAIMNDYLRQGPAEYFAKIDNDTLVPQHWLTECLNVMEQNLELDLLGIEVFDPVQPGECKRGYRKCVHIGGIGLMRTRAFDLSWPKPRGQRWGFTEWQHDMGFIVKGWLTPALPVVLLDKVPFEPWLSLTERYILEGKARPWLPYSKKDFLWPHIKEELSFYESTAV